MQINFIWQIHLPFSVSVDVETFKPSEKTLKRHIDLHHTFFKTENTEFTIAAMHTCIRSNNYYNS